MLRRSRLRPRSLRADRPRIDTSMLAMPKPGHVADAMKLDRERVTPREPSAALRNAVFQRDLGICAMCHLDCDSLENEWQDAYHRDQKLHECNICRAISPSSPCPECGAKTTTMATVNRWRFRQTLSEHGFANAETYNGGTLWQADHITAVIEGGAGQGIGNIRTLCLPCHDAVTGELAGQRARRRRHGVRA